MPDPSHRLEQTRLSDGGQGSGCDALDFADIPAVRIHDGKHAG